MECVSWAWKPIPEVVVLALEMTFGLFIYIFLEDFSIKTQTPLIGYIVYTIDKLFLGLWICDMCILMRIIEAL